ncbi:ABC transporter permease/M1 family aminopeptidase [Portibacter marinus]|uniref:ABC transporter permease/M1 family aminopeptidase n=1 Tax=Portibacter marinus TaxID=2898660 RepID=UPI001F24F5D6|nr:M1 family aminopeptidase [Portibacter marinus]
MFKIIFTEELRFWKGNFLPYVFFTFLFIVCFMSMWGMASEEISGPGMTIQNSEWRLYELLTFLQQLIIFFVPAIIGHSVYRDFSSGIHKLLYAYPIGKYNYLLAKFASAFIVLLIIAAAMGLGLFIGSLMPGVNPDAIDGLGMGRYLKLYLWILLPNLILVSAVVFALVSQWRNLYLGFIGVIILFVLTKILGAFPFHAIGYLDPFAEVLSNLQTRYWTLTEKNFNAFPVDTNLLVNRIIWILGSITLMIYTFRKFRLHHFTDLSKKRTQSQKINVSVKSDLRPPSAIRHELSFSIKDQFHTIWRLSNIDFKSIITSWPFIILLLIGFIMVHIQQRGMAPQHGVPILPTTAEMLRIPMFIFSGIFNLLTFLYSGLLIFRDRQSQMSGLIDTTPQPNHVFLLTKWLAVLKMQWVLLSIILIAGISVQISEEFYQIDLAHYLFELFILQFIHFAIWACVAMFIHSLIPNMYVSFIILLLIPVAVLMMPTAAEMLDLPWLGESVLHFNLVPDIYVGFTYSDFNGYGSMLSTYVVYKAYWALGALILLCLANVIWKRGRTFTMRERLQNRRRNVRGTQGLLLMGFFLLYLSMGGWVYHQEHHRSRTFYTQDEEDQIYAENEKRYAQYMGMVQPRLAAAHLNMDIYPDTRDFHLKGNLTYVNKVDQEIDTILVGTSFKDSVVIDMKTPATLLHKDHQIKYALYVLDQPLCAGDSLQMTIDIQNHPNTLFHDNSRVNTNGTFITGQIIPTLGVRHAFLKNADKRKKYGLQDRTVKELLPSDPALLGYEFFPNNMGRIEYETVITTSEDQIGLSMGDLIDSGERNGRRYFHYKSNGPIKNSISWISGKYDMKSEGLIDVYHHPDHHFNVDYLIEGAQMSMAYCEQWFGPLQHEKLRMVEFPLTEGSYASLNGNMIPISEVKMLCDIDHEKNSEYNHPFFVAAHEIAHYWWGHKVDPANVKGGQLVSEGLAEYISKRVVEQRYGQEVIRKHREKEQNMYFEIRGQKADEVPLNMANLDQQYLNYVKGGLCLTLLSEYIGEVRFNQALAKFEKTYRYKAPPFATSLVFLDTLRNAVPDSLHYLVEDLFETITLYDHSIKSAVRTDKWLEVIVQARKYRSDAQGRRQEVNEFKDYIRIGLVDANGVEKIEWICLDQGLNTIKFKVDSEIVQVVIDPDILFLDIDRADNIIMVQRR